MIKKSTTGDCQRPSDDEIKTKMKMFGNFVLERSKESCPESDTDNNSVVVEDGSLATVDITSDDEFELNVTLIKVPEHLRSSTDPHFELATVDRSVPGHGDLEGDAILDKLYPEFSKVTLFETPDPQEEDITPERIRFPNQEPLRPPQVNASISTNNRMRPKYLTGEKNYRKPAQEPRSWMPPPPPHEVINPWIPGAEPFIKNIPNVPLKAKMLPRNLEEYPGVRRPVNDGYGPNRDVLPYKNAVGRNEAPLAKFPTVYDDSIPPRYPGDFSDGPPPQYFDDGPQPGYSGDFGCAPPPHYSDDGPQPGYSGDFGCAPPPHYSDSFSDGPPRPRFSTGLLRTPNKFNKLNRRMFQSRMNGMEVPPMNGPYAEEPRVPVMGYNNRNSRDGGRYQNKKKFKRGKSYPQRGQHNTQNRTFQNAPEENFVENRQRGGNRQRHFRRRRRQNF